MNAIVFTVALFFSLCLVAQMADACFGNKERRQVMPLIVSAAIWWGLFYWLAH